MSKQDFVQPNRPLSADFTSNTLRRAIVAKRQSDDSIAQEENFRMKARKLMTRPVGVFLALAVVAAGGLTTYAAANWFGGNVGVTSDNSVMTVDLSKCQGNLLPPGIEQNTDHSKVQFKITGTPHISEGALQQHLLADCEWQVILQNANQDKLGATASTVAIVKSTDVSAKTLTATITFGGSTFDKTFTLDPSTKVYNKGVSTTFSSVKPGDEVVLMYSLSSPVAENDNPFNHDVNVRGVFVTQYDLRDVVAKEKPPYGQPNNIMPLSLYNELHNKK